MDEQDTTARIFELLVEHGSAPDPLPGPWGGLLDGPNVVGPIRDAAAAVVQLHQFQVHELQRCRAISYDGQGCLRIHEPLRSGAWVVCRYAVGMPMALLTAGEALGLESRLPIELALDDHWTATRADELGFVVAVSDISEMRIYRALGIPATLWTGLDGPCPWLLADSPDVPVAIDAEYAAATETLRELARAQERAEESAQGCDENPGPDSETRPAQPVDVAGEVVPGQPDRVVPAPGVPKAKADSTQPLAVNPPADVPVVPASSDCDRGVCEERPTEGYEPNEESRADVRQGLLVVLPAVCLHTLRVESSDELNAIAVNVHRLRTEGGLSLSHIRVWKPAPDFLERVRFRLELGMHDQVRREVHESLQVTSDIGALIESAPLPAIDLVALADEVIDAITADTPPSIYRERLTRALAMHDEEFERTLIAPRRAQAMVLRDPQVRALGVQCAEDQAVLTALRLRLRAELRWAMIHPEDAASEERLTKLLDDYRSLSMSTIRRESAYERQRESHW